MDGFATTARRRLCGRSHDGLRPPTGANPRREVGQGLVQLVLARAQRALIAKPCYGVPFYWAGPVVSGDGAVAFTLENRPSDR